MNVQSRASGVKTPFVPQLYGTTEQAAEKVCVFIPHAYRARFLVVPSVRHVALNHHFRFSRALLGTVAA
jgi:hypothetical protein